MPQRGYSFASLRPHSAAHDDDTSGVPSRTFLASCRCVQFVQFLLAILAVGLHSPPASWYASPKGLPTGHGTPSRPWDLQTALSGGNGRIQPGDTVWLRGGTYR